MPSAHRIPGMVYIMVPPMETDREQVQIGRRACRVALDSGKQAMFPLLHYWALYHEKELGTQLKVQSKWWLKRCDQIWLCIDNSALDNVELDQLNYWLLLENEGLHTRRRRYDDGQRRRVYLLDFSLEDSSPVCISRARIEHLLKCSIMPGLLAGVG